MKTENIDKLVASKKQFLEYVAVCNRNFRSITPSIYLYRKIFEKQETVNYQVEKLIKDQEFLELVYVTLVSWNMNMRGARMADFNSFADSIQGFSQKIAKLSGMELNLLSESEIEHTLELTKLLFLGLKVMKSKSKIVGVSKTLHFLLPKLFPPMDRRYTMNFFYGHFNYHDDVNKEYKSVSNLLREFYRISQKLNLTSKDVDKVLWNTTVPKLIDNAIIGFVSGKS